MSNETKMYGISNCDTVKKARNWMERNGINYVFHDYKKSGISKEKLEMWVMMVGWEALVNKRGTTFRKLPDMVKENIGDGDGGKPQHDQTAGAGTWRRAGRRFQGIGL